MKKSIIFITSVVIAVTFARASSAQTNQAKSDSIMKAEAKTKAELIIKKAEERKIADSLNTVRVNTKNDSIKAAGIQLSKDKKEAERKRALEVEKATKAKNDSINQVVEEKKKAKALTEEETNLKNDSIKKARTEKAEKDKKDLEEHRAAVEEKNKEIERAKKEAAAKRKK